MYEGYYYLNIRTNIGVIEMVIYLMLLTTLWTMSVLSLAGWRFQILSEKGIYISPLRDWIVQIYLKGSGITILCCIFMIVTRI